MYGENNTVSQAYSDVVKVAKFFLSCFGVVASSFVLAYNLGITKYNFPNVTGSSDKNAQSLF